MPEYEWILCKAPSQTDPFAPLEKIGNLTEAKSRQFELVRNRGGSASFSLRINDDAAYEILDKVDLGDVRGTVRKCIRIRRNKVDLWSGPIWGISGSVDEGMINVSCVGWLETLQKRILWSTLDYSNNGLGVPADQIAFGLINKVNSQYPSHPLLIRPGNVYGTLLNRNRFYVSGQVLGPALQELSDIEAGYDYVVDPVTRNMNLYNWDQFTTRNNIILGYNWGPRNIQKLSWQEDASKACNSMVVISQGAPVGPVPDLASQNEYNLFEEYNTLTGANQTVLPEYAEAELAVRSRPMITYSLVPFPRSSTNSVPALFDDYQIGDKIFFTANRDAFQVKRQAIRIFGASVSLDEVGNETITNLMTSPAT